MRASRAFLLTAALAWFLACSPDENPFTTSGSGGATVCAAGQQINCGCPGGGKGVQVCRDDGSGFDPCGCGGNGGGGSGGGSACAPGAQVPCYTGPAGTENVGLCVAGTKTCNAEGSGYGPCAGEVTPVAETCSTPGDDDCNGQSNEGGADCGCAPGAQAACYSGPPATKNVGPCHGGSQTCKPDGMGFGPCMGEVTPQPETCNTPVDDNCNGQVNEGGAGCVCVPGSTTACYDGPNGTENVGPCKGGMKTCNGLGTAYGPCLGQVLPAPDLCATPIDDDCSGSPMPCMGSTTWSHGFPVTNAGVRGLAVDGQGNVILAGHLAGNCNFGGGVLFGSNNLLPFVAKFDSTGKHLWSKVFGGAPTGGVLYRMAIDAQDNIVIAGLFSGTVDFGGGAFVSQSQDAFVVKLDPSGSHVWSKQFGDAGDQDAARGVAIDGAGNVIVIGSYQGTVNFGGVPLSSGGAHWFALKLDPAGVHVWSKDIGIVAVEGAVAADAAGNIVIAVGSVGPMDFGGGPLGNGGANTRLYTAKLGPAGQHVWSNVFGDGASSIVTPQHVGLDPAGNVLVAGDYAGALDLGGGSLGGTGSPKGLIAKFGAQGQHIWSKGFGDTLATVRGVATDASQNVFVTGFFLGAIDLGLGSLVSAGNNDVFLAKLDSAGNAISNKRFGGVNGQDGGAVALDAASYTLLAGGYQDTLDFGDGPLPQAPTYGLFVAKLMPQ